MDLRACIERGINEVRPPHLNCQTSPCELNCARMKPNAGGNVIPTPCPRTLSGGSPPFVKRGSAILVAFIVLESPVSQALPLGDRTVDLPLATGTEVLLTTDRGLATLSPDRMDDLGEVPVPGPVTAAVRPGDNPVLVVHVPSHSWLGVLDLSRFGEHRFRVISEYKAPELDRRARFVRAGPRWHLSDGNLAIAVFDSSNLSIELGQYAADFLPVVAPGGIRLPSKTGWFVLERGQVTIETTEPRTGHPRGPRQITLDEEPTAMVIAADGRHIWIGSRALDGTGQLSTLDTRSLKVVNSVKTAWSVTHLAWAEDGTLAVLGQSARKVGIFDVKRQTFLWVRSVPTAIRATGLVSMAPLPAGTLVAPSVGTGP